MKIIFNLEKMQQLILALTCVFVTSCVNSIPREEEDILSGNIPLKITASIKSAITRVTSNGVGKDKFEDGDVVGLFALVNPVTMGEERYVDNMCFTCTSDRLVAENEVFYPEGNVSLDIFSYYPYQPQGVEVGKAAIPVSVKTTQDVTEDYSSSDFLVASATGIEASKTDIKLTFNHKFTKLKIVISMGEGEDAEALLAGNPVVSISGFYTKAAYDFQDNNYSSFTEIKKIAPSGKWKIQDEKLVGKELILIPQGAMTDNQYVVLEVGGKTYYSKLPMDLRLESGKQTDLNITFRSSEDFLISQVEGGIVDWGTNPGGNSETEIAHKYIDLTKLNFVQSNVYKVIYQGEPVAEICKEYLYADNVANQAIVAYPLKVDGTTDLEKGIVMQLLGNNEKVHGGKVVWDKMKNSLVYTLGLLSPQNRFYVTKEKNISLSDAESALPVLVLSDVFRDIRGGSAQVYGIVKIGTQYWMRDNLATTSYNDGSGMTKLSSMVAGKAGYLLSKEEYYYYSPNAVLSGKLIPDGWKIPGWTEWDLLKEYLNNDATLIKSGIWKPIKTSSVFPAKNTSGFNALPVAMYVGEFNTTYIGQYASFWTVDEPGTGIAEQQLFLRSDNSVIGECPLGTDKAFPIRCIRK